MFEWFKSRSLESTLEPTKKVRVRGVKFVLKKIDPTDYMAGSKVLLSSFETYQVGGTKGKVEVSESDIKKLKQHYVDCFLASVVSPKLVRTKEDEECGDGYFVEKFFVDWDFATTLYQEILVMTYGKKKLSQLVSQGKSLLKST